MSSFFHFNAFTIIRRNGWTILLQKSISTELFRILKEVVQPFIETIFKKGSVLVT